MAKEVTHAVFWVLLVLAFLLIIVNAPLLASQKKYFYYLFAIMFMFTPILILHKYPD